MCKGVGNGLKKPPNTTRKYKKLFQMVGDRDYLSVLVIYIRARSPVAERDGWG